MSCVRQSAAVAACLRRMRMNNAVKTATSTTASAIHSQSQPDVPELPAGLAVGAAAAAGAAGAGAAGADAAGAAAAEVCACGGPAAGAETGAEECAEAGVDAPPAGAERLALTLLLAVKLLTACLTAPL